MSSSIAAMDLPKDAFVALAAVAWADERMSKREATALTRAAREAGLAPDAVAEVEAATKKTVGLDAFDPAALTPKQRALTLALANWLARVDGVSSDSEVEALAALGDALGMTDSQKNAARSAAADVLCLPQGHRPDRYDFEALGRVLVEKLPSMK